MCPSFGNTCSSSGLNQRPALPPSRSSAFRASKASCATSRNRCKLRWASRCLFCRSRIGSRPSRSSRRASSAALRASPRLTSGQRPSPISLRFPYTVRRRTHLPWLRSDFTNQSPAPSQCLPASSAIMPRAVNKSLAIYLLLQSTSQSTYRYNVQ